MAKSRLIPAWFKKYPPRTRKIIGWSLVVAVAFMPTSIFTGKKEPEKKQNEPDTNVVNTPYRTINTAIDSQDLYAYELHKRIVMQDDLPEFCAIIRKVDPTKDDYRNYCRLVVSDIVKTAHTDTLIVYIYDSNEAYELYETKFLRQYQNLDTTESNIVNEHFIATYTGKRDFSWDYDACNQLSYYENAHNGKTAREMYMPQ